MWDLFQCETHIFIDIILISLNVALLVVRYPTMKMPVGPPFKMWHD